MSRIIIFRVIQLECTHTHTQNICTWVLQIRFFYPLSAKWWRGWKERETEGPLLFSTCFILIRLCSVTCNSLTRGKWTPYQPKDFQERLILPISNMTTRSWCSCYRERCVSLNGGISLCVQHVDTGFFF